MNTAISLDLRIGFVALALLCGCATAPRLRPVTDPTTPVGAAGFSVLPPSGGRWVQDGNAARDVVLFAKFDPEYAKSGGSVIVIAVRRLARTPDYRSGDGLRSEIDEWVREGSGRHTLISSKIDAYADSALGVDCVHVETVSEERNNPKFVGKVLLLTTFGKACRQPSSPAHYVMLTCSERRHAGTAPLLDDALRKDCERSIDSLKFQPLP